MSHVSGFTSPFIKCKTERAVGKALDRALSNVTSDPTEQGSDAYWYTVAASQRIDVIRDSTRVLENVR